MFLFLFISISFILNFNVQAAPDVMNVMRGLGKIVLLDEYNPLVAPASKGYLKGLRYYGNYSTVDNSARNPLLKCIVKDVRNPDFDPADPTQGEEEFNPNNCPQDVIASLIQWLFPNVAMDGNFAPNQRQGSFKDLVSRFQPSTIGSILSVIFKANGKYEERTISELKNIIINDYKKIKTSSRVTSTHNQPIKSKQSLKAEAEENFTRQTGDSDIVRQFNEALEKLNLQEGNVGKKTLNQAQKFNKKEKLLSSRQFSVVNKYIKALIKISNKETDEKTKESTVKVDPTYIEQAELFSRILVEALKMTKKSSSSAAIPLPANQTKSADNSNTGASSLTQPDSATKSADNSNVGNSPSTQPNSTAISYHPETVVMALLYFAWEKSGTKADIVSMLEMMGDLVSLEGLQSYKMQTQAYTRYDYQKIKEASEKPDFDWKNQNLEVYTLLGLGWELFELKFPKPLDYTNVKYYEKEFDPRIQRQKAYTLYEKGKTKSEFADCGSSSLRNVFNFLLFDPESRLFDLRGIKQLKINDGFKKFYEKYNTLGSQLSPAARRNWIRVTSNLGKGITYVNSIEETGEPVCEIEVGVSNMMKVLGYLLGYNNSEDKISMAEYVDTSNLDTLLEAVSSKGRKWTWKSDSTEEDKIESEEDKDITIEFYLNGEQIFDWEFEEGHFEVVSHVHKDEYFKSPYFNLELLKNTDNILKPHSLYFSRDFYSIKKNAEIGEVNFLFLIYSVLEKLDTDELLDFLKDITINNPSINEIKKAIIRDISPVAANDPRTLRELLEKTLHADDLFSYALGEVGEEAISTIKHLSAENRQLTRLPSSMVQLPNLIQLNISKNDLTSLPEDISRLSKLKYFDASENKLSKLPDSIFGFV